MRRWCNRVCRLQPGSVILPCWVENSDGALEIGTKSISILWPWDVLHWLWETKRFEKFGADADLRSMCRQYWSHCQHLPFYQALELSERDHEQMLPLVFHGDGVRIFKQQKAFVYSWASALKKGTSLQTKAVLLLVREYHLVKGQTHDAVGHVISYITEVLRSGLFPLKDLDGADFAPGSKQAMLAGSSFCGGYRACFAGWKGDWEARVQVHKLQRHYGCLQVCEKCPAMKTSDVLSYGDFRPSATHRLLTFSHEEYLDMTPKALQSSWTAVKGWSIHRNLEAFRRTCGVKSRVSLLILNILCNDLPCNGSRNSSFQGPAARSTSGSRFLRHSGVADGFLGGEVSEDYTGPAWPEAGGRGLGALQDVVPRPEDYELRTPLQLATCRA